MKAYDPTGEYTPEEVERALRGENNTRKISIRYERLDRHNNKIEDIDYVSKGTVENNYLADIKRTAKFEMYDEGNFNFQQDRIKPYVRIEMPEDRNYNSRIASLNPALHYPLNESAISAALQHTNVPAGTYYNSRATAFVLTLRDVGTNSVHAPIDTTNPAFWSTFQNNSRRALNITMSDANTGFETNLRYTIYFAADVDSDLLIIRTGSFHNSVKDTLVTLDQPDVGYYFVELTPADTNPSYFDYRPQVAIARPIAVQDISESGIVAYTQDYNFGGAPLINDQTLAPAPGDSDNLLTEYTFRNTVTTFAGSSMPYPLSLDPRNPVRTFGFSDQGLYWSNQSVPAKAGDKFYIEFVAKKFAGQDTNPYPIRVGIQPITSGDATIAGWDSTVLNGNVRKIEELENGWARYAATPFIPSNLTTTAKARISVFVQQRFNSTVPETEWAIQNVSWRWVKRADGYVSGADVNERSLSIPGGATQKWSTLPNQSLRMGTGLTTHWWQRLTNASDGFKHTATFYDTTGYAQVSVVRTENGAGVYNVKVVNTSDYNNFTFSASVTLPANHFDVKNNAYAVQLDADFGRIRLFRNAALVGTFALDSGSAPFSAIKSFFDPTNVVNRFDISFASTATKQSAALLVDDYSLYTTVIEAHNLLDITEIGRKSRSLRKGYVEWPQGVFLISAPNRVMNDGTTVTRSVTAYDQLLVLKEDSYDARFAAIKGEKYTDVIDKVYQSTIPPQKITTMSPIWTMSNGVVRETEEVVSFPAGTDKTAPAGFVTAMDKIVLTGSSISAKMPSTTSYWELGYYRKNSQYMDAYWYRDGAMLTAGGYGSQFIATTTYNATTHAYLRVRESFSDKRIYFEYSSDGQAWTVWGWFDYTAFVANGNPLSGNSTTMVGIKMAGAGVATKVRVSGVVAAERAIVDRPDVLPSTMEWEPGTSKLKVINDLLSAINYDSATFDEDGKFIAKPYVSPTLRASEYTYATNEFSVISGDVTQELDLTAIPNVWIMVVSLPDKAPMVAKYENNNANSITSTVATGRRIVEKITENEAASQTVLNDKVRRRAIEASQIYEHIEFETALMPIHTNSDVYTLVIDGLLINDKYSETAWSMELAPGAVMKHKVRRTISI